MPRARRYALTLLAAVLTLRAFAQLVPLDPAAMGGAEVEVIIELTEPPMLAQPQSREMSHAAASAIDTQIAQLAGDLDRIEHRDRAIAASRPPFRFQYRLTFAGASARVKRESIAAIRALPYVKAVHADRRMQAHLVNSVPHIGAPKVWTDYGVRGRGVVIAILDTGIDYTHRSLGKGFGPGFKVIGGYDFVNDDRNPIDDMGHGTHVAGIAAGDLAPVLGVAPQASLLAYKVLDSEGGGQISTILAGIERATDPNADGDPSDRADVINMSLGGPRSWEDPLIAAIERAVAAGAVACLSAGNSAKNGAIGSPAAAPSAITIAATDAEDARAVFSSRGPVGGEWLAKPEIGAPGVRIVSAARGGGTVEASGTSMSAPHIAGVAALLLEKHPDWTPQDVKAAIVSTGKPAFFDEDRSRQSVVAAGGGRVDARAAIDAAILPNPATVSFGVVMKRGTPFTATRTVSLSNRGDETETVAIETSVLPAGMTLTASPASVVIRKGESAEVTLTLSLAAATPRANEDEIATAGLIALKTSRMSQRLPWLAVNGNMLVATFTGSQNVATLLSARTNEPVTWPAGPRAIAAFVSDTAEVVGYFEPAPGDLRRLVVREQIPIDGYTAVTVSPDDARFKVEFAGVDERGIPFARLAEEGSVTSRFQQHFLLRGDYLVALPELAGMRNERALWVSPLTQTGLRAIEVVSAKDAQYATMYPLLFGLTKDERVGIAGPWASQTVEHRCRTPRCTVYVAPGAGSFALYDWYEAATGPKPWTLFLTPRVAEQYDFRAYVVVREEGWTQQPGREPWNYVSPPFRNDGGRIAASPFGRAVPSADYVSPSPDRAVILGDGPPVLRTGIGTHRVDMLPYGAALGESLGDAAAAFELSLYSDSTGKAVGYIPTGSPYVFLTPGVDQPYRIEMSLPYTLERQSGRLSQTTRWDPKNYWSGPTITMLRVEDGAGSLSNSVLANTRGRLVFAGRDTATYRGASVVHRFLNAPETRVSWRPHGSSADWQPLSISHTGSDYENPGNWPGSPGDFFAADLLPATASLGAIDIKILIVNYWGATSEVVWEPLFFVRDAAPKRRSVR